MTVPLFKLGRVLATPGAIEALNKAGQAPFEFIARHCSGDWGELCDEDRNLNDKAVNNGTRILSVYRLETGEKVWVITEAEDDLRRRAATIVTLPDEY